MNLTELLRNSAIRYPHRTAIVDGEESITYSQLVEAVQLAADALAAAGVHRHTMTGLQFHNSIAFVVLSYAIWLREGIVVPMPIETQPQESDRLSERMSLAVTLSCRRPPPPHACTSINLNGTAVWMTTRSPADGFPEPEIDAAFVRFTSGTTSHNKGVVLSHERIMERIMAADDLLDVGPEDTVMWPLPMAHHFVVTIIRYIWRGVTIVLLRQLRSEYILDQIDAHAGTVMYASPLHYDILSRDESGRSMGTIRCAISTTTGLSEEIAARFTNRFGMGLVQAYGIIELGLACINTDAPSSRPGSVGRPAPGFSIRLARQEEYTNLGDGVGEVEVKGPGFFDAYYDPWIRSDDLMADGWFHTGDIGRVDEDGFLFLHSRVSSVINTAGMKVFPEEVEGVLNRHDAVWESHVYGVPHAHLGEVPEAEIVLHSGQPCVDEPELRAHCSQYLSSFKIPNGFVVVEQLQRTTTSGKIIRR